MRKIIILIITVLLLASCALDDKKVDENGHINYRFTNMNTPLDLGYFTESNNFIYFLDRGRVYVYDDSISDVFELAKIDTIDDHEVDLDYYGGKSNEGFIFEHYSELSYENFLQAYEEKLYFTSEYLNIEGENYVKLSSLDLNGENKQDVMIFDTLPYDLLISHGYIFYREISSDKIYATNLSSKDSKEIVASEEYTYLSYVITEKDVNFNFINTTNGKVSLFSIDYETLLMTEVMSNEYPFSKSSFDTFTLSFEELNNLYPAVLFENGEKVNELGNVVVDYIDDDFIYASSPDDPQIYTIFDHDGSLVHTLQAPSRFIKSDIFAGFTNQMSVSRVIAVYGDRLLVIGNTEQNLEVYLVNILDNEWQLIYSRKK